MKTTNVSANKVIVRQIQGPAAERPCSGHPSPRGEPLALRLGISASP
jgi:hypothetical protein